MSESFRATLAEPPPSWTEAESFRPGASRAVQQRKSSVVDSAGDWFTSVVSHARFSLGLPQDNTYRRNLATPTSATESTNEETFADKMRSSKGMGNLNQPNPETLDYFDPEPMEYEVKKKSSALACGVGLTFAFDEEEDAVVVTGIVKGAPAARTDRVEIGDYLLEVDGIAVRGQPLEVVHSIVRGIEGSHCSMVFWRPDEESEDVTDEHTHVVNMLRERLDEITEYTAPSKCGVGITFETVALDGSARVKALVRDSDSEKSGLIQKGDVLYEVDRTNVFREPLDIVSDLIMGEEGTKVRLLFLRGTRTFVEVFVHRTNLRISEMQKILLHAQHTTRLAGPKHPTHTQTEKEKADTAALSANNVGVGSIFGQPKTTIKTNSSRTLNAGINSMFAAASNADSLAESSAGTPSQAAVSITSRGTFAPPPSAKMPQMVEARSDSPGDLPWDKPPAKNPPKKALLGSHPTGLF